MDALTTKRGIEGGEDGGVMTRVVNQVKRLKEIVQRVDKLVVVPLSCLLLISYLSKCVYNVQLLLELDGAEERPGVYVIGATNRCIFIYLNHVLIIITSVVK